MSKTTVAEVPQTCIDCGAEQTTSLFGLWWCDEHMPQPPIDDNTYYELVYTPGMRRVLAARDKGLDSVKVTALMEMKGDSNETI